MLRSSVVRLGGPARNFLQNVVRRAEHYVPDGYPGAMVPYKLPGPTRLSRFVFMTKACLFVGIPFGLPFFVLRHHLKKGNPGYVRPK